MKQLQSPLKWAGGKRWLVPFLRPTWTISNHMRLVEPFCGGLSIALGLLPQRALINDINPYLINFYQYLKKGLELKTKFENSSEVYYRYRDEFNYLISIGQGNSQHAAELFFYLNKTCFNGLCRFNHDGRFNVPFGKHKNINYDLDLMAYKEKLTNWIFTSGTYKDMTLENNDFVFADPPYDVEFRHYSQNGFSWNDQMELVDWIRTHKGPIVLCNQATDRIINLYDHNGFDMHFMTERIYIKANGDRTPAKVIIATKNINIVVPDQIDLGF